MNPTPVITHSPPLRNPFTDLGASLLNQQFFGRCAFFEMRYMECLEAYGADRGQSNCKLQREDFNECSMQGKQMARYIALRQERERQKKEHHLKNAYLPPPPKDAFTFTDNH